MKKLGVIKWMFSITLFVALAAGGAGFYVWRNANTLVEAEVRRKFSEMAPDFRLEIGDTRLHGTTGATLSKIRIHDGANGHELFRAEELNVDIDSTLLTEHGKVSVQKLRLKSADIVLTRHANGRWNWHDYSYQLPTQKSSPLPQIEIIDFRVQLTLHHGSGIPSSQLPLRSPRFQAVPASAQQYDFDGGILLPGAGLLKLGGLWDLQSGRWKIGGRMQDVMARQDLMRLALATNPNLSDHLQQIDTVMTNAAFPAVSSTDNDEDTALLVGTDQNASPRIRGLLDLNFNAGSVEESKVPDFQLLVQIREGQISSPLLPFGLTDVTAKLYKDNDSLEFRLLKARGEGAQLSGDLLLSSSEDFGPPTINFSAKRLPISRKLRNLLKPKARRIFDTFSPEGTASVTGQIVQQEHGRWRPENVRAEIHDGTVVHQRFQYPVRNVRGTIVQRPFAETPASATQSAVTKDDVVLDVEMTGEAGGTSGTATGWWKNPGPVTETRIEVKVNDFPVDHAFRAALEETPRRVAESLNVEGRADATLIFYRPPGLDKKTSPYFDIQLSDARMRFEKFPYDITDLSGRLTYHGPSKHWRFLDLKGRHGKGDLHAAGDFRLIPDPGVLDLIITAKATALDSDLYNALSPTHRNLWDMVDPNGFCDLTAQIQWTAGPGRSAVVSFPEETPVRIYDTQIRPTTFPFEMFVREATLSYDPNDARNAGVQHCEIHTFDAAHDDARMNARGWIEGKPDGEWQIHLNHLNAKNLKPDDQLRAALPASWKETLGRVHHVGEVAIWDSELDFRGDSAGKKQTTAGWNLNIGFQDCTLSAGLDVEHIYGAVTAQGFWDGFHLQNSGQIRLDTAEVLEMPFTNISGPYSQNDVELVLGNRDVFQKPLAQVDNENRMKCQAYGGQLLFDATVDMRDEGQYRFFTELANARLEHYASLHIPDQQNLKGIVTAWMRVDGFGDDVKDLTGKGQLRISPAALYELPVMVKLLGSLSQLNMNVQNLTAFDYALLNFEVRDEKFDLQQIDLVGESLSLRGQGAVGFDGAVNLDFYSRPARSRTVAIPFISGLFTNWVKIEITGTTDRPYTRTEPLGQLDEGLKQLLQPFNPNAAGPVPGLVLPIFLQPSSAAGPLQRRGQSAFR